MADPIQLPEPLQQIVDAQLGYYRALGRVTADYVKALGRVWTDAAGAIIPGMSASSGATGGTGANARATAAPASRGAPAAPAATASSAHAPPALVLEAEAGQSAQAVFMVNNELARAVTAAVHASDFTGPDGRPMRPALRVQPGTVALEPGGRQLVQISVFVDEQLEPGVGYRGEVNVPGLSDTPVPVLLRRKATVVEPEATSSSAAPVATARPKRGGNGKSHPHGGAGKRSTAKRPTPKRRKGG